MSNMRAEDVQRKLLQKKTEELLKKMAETNQALNQTATLSIPVRKSTARKSTHTSRNNISPAPTNDSAKTPKLAPNCIRKAIHTALKPERKTKSSKFRKKQLNGFHKETIPNCVNNNNHDKTKAKQKETIKANNATINNTGKVELIKETIQGIKGTLGAFLKAKSTNIINNNKKKLEIVKSAKQTEPQRKSDLSSDLSCDFDEEELYEDDVSDVSLPANVCLATGSEDAGSEEGLKLWLDESSASCEDAEAAAHAAGCSATDSEEKKVAAVAIQRLPTGVIHRLSSAGRIKVHLKTAKRLRSADDLETRPEVSVIDGIEFYSFETEEDLIEYTIQDQKLKLPSDDDLIDESDVCAYAQPIIPTKTNDITQIKGWRSKIFAAETTGGDTPNLAGITDFNWLKKVKCSTDGGGVSCAAGAGSVVSPKSAERTKCAGNIESKMESGSEDAELADEDERNAKNNVKTGAGLSLKTYGTTDATHADESRFNELYFGSRKMLPTMSKPYKTKYGWFQQFGCVKVAVGAASDSAPTFTPHQPLFTYDNKDMSAILAARNKNAPLEELSLPERGLITPNWAKFAVEALRTADAVLNTTKTVIKIDETKRPTKTKINLSKPSNLNGKSILKKTKVYADETPANPDRSATQFSPLGQQKAIDGLVKRGVQVSFEANVERARRDDGCRLSESLSDIADKVVSAPPDDYVELVEPPRCDEPAEGRPACGQTFCRLGCVCESIQVRKRKRPHCGKLDCMFVCDCGFTISSKTTGMMHKILSPSIQSCDRGENFNSSPILTDDGPIKRRRVSRPPARLMDSDFVCKSAKDLLVLPQPLRDKMHVEKRFYTKFERKVYNRAGNAPRGRRLAMTNGSCSPREEQEPRHVEPPRVPPIRIVNLKGHIPKVSPVHEPERANVEKSPNAKIGKSQHVLPCGTTIVNGKVSLAIPKETNARALLTMGEIGKGKSSLRFIGLRMNNSPNVMHSTEDAQSLGRNLTPDVAKDMLATLNLQQKAPLGGAVQKSVFQTMYAKLCGRQSVEKIIGYVIANENLKYAVALAKSTEAPVSAPVSFTVADFVRSEVRSSRDLETPQFNIYPIINCSTHVFVGPFDKILPNIFRELVHESPAKAKDVNKEVRAVVSDLLDCVCQVMEPAKYVGSANINYKVADKRISLGDDHRFSRITISGNKVVKNKASEARAKPGPGPGPARSRRRWVDKDGTAKAKSGIDPKYLPQDVVNLAYRRQLELNMERKYSELHRQRERTRRKSEINQFERLGAILEQEYPGGVNNKYFNKPKLLTNALRCIRQLESDVTVMERVKLGLMNKRYSLFHRYKNLLKDAPEARRDEAVRKLTEGLRECCKSRADRQKLLDAQCESEVLAKRKNGKRRVLHASSDSDSSSGNRSSAKASLTESDYSNDGNDDNLLSENVEETDLVMTVEGECDFGNEETPGLFMYAEVDDEVPETRTQETIIDNELKSTSTAVNSSSVGVRLNAVSTIPIGQNVVLQFNDAAALTDLLSNQSAPAPVLLIANQAESCVELPKIVGCATISEAEFWADS